MNTAEFLKVKKFSIKAKNIDFEQTKFYTAIEKNKLYSSFIKFVNSNFSQSSFSKALYNFLHCNCGFIAHYNLHGFYGEYFAKGAALNKIAFDTSIKCSEYSGINP